MKIKCKIEQRIDTQVAGGPRGGYKDPKDKCIIGDNPPITVLIYPCGVHRIRTVRTKDTKFKRMQITILKAFPWFPLWDQE